MLVVGGSLVGFAPGVPEIELEPDLVLLIFLPPLLFNAAYFSSIRDLRADLRSIAFSAIGLVLLTTCTVAVVAHAAIDGLPWAAAFALGAIVSPTDPLAATTIARRLGVPRRLTALIEGESLINDGSALVVYRTAVVARRRQLRPARRHRRPDRERRRRHRGRRRRRAAARRGAQARRRRRRRRRRDLAGLRLRRLRAGRGARRLGRARRRLRRPDRRAPLGRHQHRGLAPARLRLLGGLRLHAQRRPVRARRAAAAADPRGPGPLGARARGARAARQPGRDRDAARVDAHDAVRDPGARPAPVAGRAADGLAPAHDRRLERPARGGLARRGARAADRVPGARPADLPHGRGDLRDAGRPGPHAAVADPPARRARRRSRASARSCTRGARRPRRRSPT